MAGSQEEEKKGLHLEGKKVRHIRGEEKGTGKHSDRRGRIKLEESAQVSFPGDWKRILADPECGFLYIALQLRGLQACFVSFINESQDSQDIQF